MVLKKKLRKESIKYSFISSLAYIVLSTVYFLLFEMNELGTDFLKSVFNFGYFMAAAAMFTLGLWMAFLIQCCLVVVYGIMVSVFSLICIKIAFKLNLIKDGNRSSTSLKD